MASLRTLKDSSLASLRASQAVARGGKIQLGGRSAATCRRAFSGVSRRTPGTGTRAALLWTSVAGLAASVYWWQLSPIHNEVPAAQNEAKGSVVVQRIIVDDDDQHLNASVWGSNRSNVISPATPDVDSIRSPSAVAWLRDVALRDMALHEHHGACVDARGDVYQWGDGFFGDAVDANKARPVLTLRGKDIVTVQITASKLVALSSTGKIYVMRTVDTPSISEPSSAWSLTGWLFGAKQSSDYTELITDANLSSGEKFISISAGTDHLLALTSTGRTFSHPLSLRANSNGQLGFRKLVLPAPESSTHPEAKAIELIPKAITDPFAKAAPHERIKNVKSLTSLTTTSQAVDDSSLKFCDRLFEIQTLKGLQIVQAVAGGRSSFARLAGEGRVLAWGANEYGQLGLGSTMTVDTFTVPTEVVLSRGSPPGTKTRCIDIIAGGDLTLFMVERVDGSFCPTVDVLACGNGQWGGIGNALYSNSQGNPARVKAVSGLLEYSEDDKNMQAIVPHAISISPTGHVLLTLDTLRRAGAGVGGRDLFVWGLGRDYELGTGKRGNVATPQNIEHPRTGRYMLGKRMAEVKDLAGKVWKRKVAVEQCAVAGYGASVVYWKICRE